MKYRFNSEVEKLTKALEGAYINDGLTNELANKYSTTLAVKAITQNCTNDKVKLIMQAGTFNTMNDAISKFVNSCTEATGQPNTVLYYQQRINSGYNRGNHGYYRGRGNYYQNRNQGNNRGRSQYKGNYRGRGNSNRGHNSHNVRVTQNASGNSQQTLDTQQ